MKKSDLVNLNEYFRNYINNVKEENVIDAFESSLEYTRKFLLNIPKEKLEYKYQHDKWTIKEIILHLIDSERIMGYRALTFARNDKNELWGYDQDNYIKYSNANKRSIEDLIEDFTIARRSNIVLFNSFDDEMFMRKGFANKKEQSVLLLGFLIVGHELHHLKIIKDRYLNIPS
jgi:hypothetical protein